MRFNTRKYKEQGRNINSATFSSIAKFLSVSTVCVLSITFLAYEASAQTRAVPIERAEGVELAKATGHYARARTMLIAAIREFDKGTTLVNPNAVLDSDQWRTTLIQRARDLEHILDPQPRVSESGIRYEAFPQLLGEAQGLPPSIGDQENKKLAEPVVEEAEAAPLQVEEEVEEEAPPVAEGS